MLAALPITSALAAPITPTFSNFGELTGATFGGNGIANTSVAISTGNGVVLGLTAHQRYSSSAVTNNGAGVFTAQAGVDTHVPSSATDPYAMWNFAFYVSSTTLSNYYVLSYDFDPSANDASTHGTIGLLGSALGSNPFQNSWNLGMNFLDATAGSITQPVFPSFDPTVAGQYTFAPGV